MTTKLLYSFQKSFSPAERHKKVFENFPEVDHEERANDDEKDKVNEGEKTVGIHHVVHNVDPALE